ncbi:peptidase M38 [Rhizobium sp. LCM 4573]|nr:amidohydrolase family protein [Rhizobium sp. LCM 4573]OHV78519.1 peptidase M38 [Rhizobium sp. LCM 4573]
MFIRNAAIVDGLTEERHEPVDIRFSDGKVVEVGKSLPGRSDNDIDLAGLTVLPGLIDCHVHVIAATANLGRNAELPNSYVALAAGQIMRGMLMRGFTTVRDLGGADHGLVTALDSGLIQGPRLVICGKALSQTGGHTDYRDRANRRSVDHYPDQLGALGRICDGVDAVRRAAREELKAGAAFIKVMANGGVSSPTDPIDALAFSSGELRAAVEEAANQHTYVAAHLYTDEAIARALDCGVRSIEHGNLIKSDTAARVREAGAVVVPTNITYAVVARDGARYGMSAESLEKVGFVLDAGLAALETLRDAGVVMGYGSDLLGEMHGHQSEEFVLRGRVLRPHEVIRSATADAARVLGMEGQIGALVPGAHADLIAVEGNPLDDLAILTNENRIRKIIKAGRLVKNE